MFQYAFLEALKSRGRNVYGNLGFYRRHAELRPFQLNSVFQKIDLEEIDDETFAVYDRKWKNVKNNSNELEYFLRNYKQRFFYVEEKDGVYDEHVFDTEQCVFVGFWQTEKYFKEIETRIREKFEFQIADVSLLRMAERLKNNYFGVHVRRGDYLSTPNLYGGICTLEYYRRAIACVEDIVPEAKFIFFSDDKEWVRQHFNRKNMEIFEGASFQIYQDWYDLYLMTKCAGNVIANSSFSWWGAWLNQNPGKIVIAPKEWLLGMDTTDIWCKEWIRM